MRRLTQLLGAAALVAAMVPSFAHAASPTAKGSFTRHTFTAAGLPSRDYYLYVPKRGPAKRPLLVLLHGCNIGAQDMARISRFNDVADRYGFEVVYPEERMSQNSSAPLDDGNGVRCWNWFLPDDQNRDAGEPGTIAGITREVMATQRIDGNRVYVEGISAGADMAVILGANYPDLYAAVGALAGCAYRTCGDGTGALTNAAMGENARVVPMFVENGSADSLNNIAMAAGLVSSWLGADDLADGGGPDGSVSQVPASSETFGTDQTPQPGSGDPCIHNNTLTCPGGVIGFQGTYPYTVANYDDAHGCDVLDFWVIHGMEHAYPNGPAGDSYTDPLGPDVSTASWQFFAAHPMTHGSPEACAS